MPKNKILLAGLLLVTLVAFASCGTRRGCDGKTKSRVDMGWM